MPRAFLITNRRYNSAVDFEENHKSRECSPERRVFTADGLDSEADSIGLPSSPYKPTSPHSPAHESRSRQQSPANETQHVMGLTIFRPMGHITPPPPSTTTTYTNLPVAPGPDGRFRQCQSTTSALVTVIRQLMQHQQQQQQPTVIRQQQHSPDSSPGPQSPSELSDSHVCTECGKRYSTSSNLARHRQTHRSVTDKKARKCPHCEKVYVSMPAFSMHVRTHSQGCQCPYCGKCFSRPWLLQGHIRTHTGEKPFTCPICRKAFADKSNLRAHIQTHSSSKPYVCQRCGKAFALKSYLYKHEESSCMRVHRQQQDGIEKNNVVLDLATTKEEKKALFVDRGSAVIVG